MVFPGLRYTWAKRQIDNKQLIGLCFVFLWFYVGGIMHFVATDFEASIVPPWIPWPRAVVMVSGVLELAGALGIIIPSTRKAAGAGLFMLTLAVTPANIYMLQRPELFGISMWLLWMRLPLQVALLWLILWSTRRLHRRR
ncbi:DoxX family protein [Noviherbaspirillum pedocola]|uniref:DoxX family protein n=1 Tax=Noviherbaspirillum pedocola TaxID=2801341 RepID=A0A934T452_9BURK|nr:DoxX family protein [Noviherbaspirillum pedocola]MBK4738593.1 DoxX family protein [Noviherbaspirillum pedocola]